MRADNIVIDGITYRIPNTPEQAVLFDLFVAHGLNPRWATGAPGYVRPDDTLDDRL